MSDISIRSRLTKVNTAVVTKDKLLDLLRRDGLVLPMEVSLLVNNGDGYQWKEGSIRIEWEEVGMRITCPKCKTAQPTDTSDNTVTCMECKYTWQG